MHGESNGLHQHNRVQRKGETGQIDYSPWWWCIASYSILHPLKCSLCESKTEVIDEMLWWFCMANYSMFHSRNKAQVEGEPDFIDNLPWWRWMANYVISNRSNHAGREGEATVKGTKACLTRARRYQRTSRLDYGVIDENTTSFNYYVRCKDELDIN